MLPIDRSAKAVIDANLVNGVLSDGPKLKANDDVLYNTIDELYNFTTGLLSTSVLSRLNWVNIANYGAIGNGIANDTAAFLSAISAVNTAGGGVVVIPKGNYLVSPDIIKVCNNLELKGIGKPRIFTNFGDSYQWIIGSNSGDNITNYKITGIVFDQFSNVGNYSISGKATKCIATSNVFGTVEITDCDFNFIGVHCAYIWSEQPNCRVIFRNNRLFFKKIYDMAYDASALYFETVYHDISFNYFENLTPSSYTYAFLPGGIETHGQTAYIAYNVFQGNSSYIGAGINVTDLEAGNDQRLVRGTRVLEGNQMHGVQTGIALYPYHTDDSINNLIIRDNLIELIIAQPSSRDGVLTFTTYYGIGFMTGQVGSIKNIKIYNNKIKFVGSFPTKTGWIYDNTFVNFMCGVYLESTDQADVYNNTFENLPMPALGLGTTTGRATNINFHDNVIIDCCQGGQLNTTGPQPNAIFALTGADYVTIQHNQVIWTNNIAYANADLIRINLLYMRNSSPRVTNVAFQNNTVTGQSFITYKLVVNGYDTNTDWYVDIEHIKWLRNPQPAHTYVEVSTAPTTGNYSPGDFLLYIGTTAVANFRGYKCTVRGTPGTLASTTVSFVDNSQSNFVTLSFDTGGIGSNGLAMGQAVKVNEATAITRDYGFIVGKCGSSIVLYNKDFTTLLSFVGSQPLIYMNPTFVTVPSNTTTFGTNTLSSGATSFTQNHNNPTTPTNIICTPHGNVGNWWITNITSTQFTFNCSVAPGSNTSVSWEAKV